MKKPKAKIIGEDGNMFNILAIARNALIKADLKEKVKTMEDRVYNSESYDEALCIIMEYVEVE